MEYLERENKIIRLFREAFQTKKRGIFGPGPNRGSQKNKKVPSFIWEQFKIRGGVLGNFKKSQVPEIIQISKIMTHFHLIRTNKHKILSFVALNMAKYTIISLILIDFVPMF